MRSKIQKVMLDVIQKLQASGEWPAFELPVIEVTYPKNENFGDYASNVAMILAKSVGKNPMEIANNLKVELGSNEELQKLIEKIEVLSPGYINFHLSVQYFAKLLEEICGKKGNFGNLTEKEKIMVEYSQPNTHKEFHVGHLRNVVTGSVLVNVLRKAGKEVVAANYIGDTGTHVAKCLWGLQKFHKDVKWNEIDNKAEFLGKVYSESVKAIEENEEFQKEFREVQKRFESGDGELQELWQKTRQISLEGFDKIYQELGTTFDVFFYESEEEVAGREMLPKLLENSFIRKSDGAVIADLEEHNLGVLVLQRSDGAILYGLKDIPLAVKKFENFDIAKSFYVIDIRQNLYMKQIFKILELIGFRKKLVHVGYDFVTLKGGEGMSSRKGNVVPAKSFMEEIEEKVKEKFPESPDPSQISMGAMKFFMLKYATSSKIEFDINESVKLEGATGPYVQYAYARISSILRKAQEKNITFEEADLSLIRENKELGLMRELNVFPELVADVSQNLEVQKLPYYCLKLADKFHSFYNDHKVIDEENPELTKARLKLVFAVKIVLGETLRLIGVGAPEKM